MADSSTGWRAIGGTAMTTVSNDGVAAEECSDVDDDEALSDEELTALALAADPNAPLAASAIALESAGSSGAGLLPSWYMPAIAIGRAHRYWKVVVIVLVSALLAIEAAGLCSTYGQLVVP
jgi:hypothetical protein